MTVEHKHRSVLGLVFLVPFERIDNIFEVLGVYEKKARLTVGNRGKEESCSLDS